MAVDNKIPLVQPQASVVDGSVAQPDKALEKPAEQVKQPDTPKPDQPPKKWAGKYDDTENLAKGTRHLWKHLGLDELPEGELVGEGKRWKSYEAMEASYANAERLARQVKSESREATAIDESKPAPKATEQVMDKDPFSVMNFGDTLRKAGIGQSEAEEAFKNGTVDEAMLESFCRSHPVLSQMPKAVRNDYVMTKGALLMMQLDNQRQNIYSMAGGKEAFETIVASLKDVVPPERQAGIVKGLKSPDTVEVAFENLKMYYDKATKNGSGPQPVSGSSAGNGGDIPQDVLDKAIQTVFRMASRPDTKEFKEAFEIVNRSKSTKKLARK